MIMTENRCASSLDRFNASATALSVAMSEIGNLLTKDPRVKFRTRSRLGASVASITAFSTLFAGIHTEAVMAAVQSTAIASQIPSARLPEPPMNEQQFLEWAEEQKKLYDEFEKANGKAWHEALKESFEVTSIPFASLHACYQAIFYMVRAAQDIICCVMLELLDKTSGQYSSMADALDKGGNPKNEVGTFLKSKLPEYLPWFTSFRDMRNKLKMGIPTSTSGPETDLGININYLDEKAGGVVCDVTRGFRLGDAADAIDKTISVLNSMKVLVRVGENV